MQQPIDIIVPVRNEAEGLERFHQRIHALPLETHLIYVDNASTDDSLEILLGFDGAEVIEHAHDEGYGGSILDGLARAESDTLVIIDADCEYPPESIPELVTALDESPVVYASRFLDGHGADIPTLKRVGNGILTSAFNLLFDQSLTDLYTGCKAMRRSAVEGLNLERRGFEHVLEFSVRLARRGIAIGEVGVEFETRQTGSSKMRHVSETAKALGLLLYYAASRDE